MAVKTEEKRQRILDAALTVFGEMGYYGSTIPRIADEAGVATGTIYVYFKDKQALVNELYLELHQRMLETVGTGGKDASPRERFHQTWQNYIRFGIDHRDVLEFIEGHHHAPYLLDQTQQAAHEVMAQFLGFVQELQAVQAIKPGPPFLLLGMIDGIAFGVLKMFWHGHLEASQEVINQAEQMAWEALRV